MVVIESFYLVSLIEESEEICVTTKLDKLMPSLISPLKLDLKPLPKNLKNMSIGDDETLSVIISRALEPEQEGKLVRVLREHRGAFGWTLSYLKGFSSTLCAHTILITHCEQMKFILYFKEFGISNVCYKRQM